MKVSITAEGLLDPRNFQAWTAKRREAIHRGVAKGFSEARSAVVSHVRAQASGAFSVKRKAWLNTFSAKVYDRRRDVLPTMHVYSRMPWMGIHERGGVIDGPVLIPLNVGRISAKKFKAMVQRLMASGNAFFKKIDGKVFLFAENIRENSRDLSKFRKAERARTGKKTVKRGTELLIGILLPRVTIRRRLRLKDTVMSDLPMIARAIERNIAHG